MTGDLPALWVAPMAGGLSTPALVIAAGAAGALGFAAAGYLTAAALDAELDQVQAAGVPYGVNLFLPSPRRPGSAAEVAGVADRVGSLAPGKDADILILSGDPLELTTHIDSVLVNGQVVYRAE